MRVATLEQVRRLRLRNSMLFSDDGLDASGPLSEQLARRLAGVQGQSVVPTGLACWNRRGPRDYSLAQFRAELASPAVVRTWGQRCTIHVYTPQHWPVISAAVGGRLLGVSQRQVASGQATGRGGQAQLRALQRAVDWARGQLQAEPASAVLSKHALQAAGHDPKLRYRVFMSLAAEGAGRLVHTSDGDDSLLAARVQPSDWPLLSEADAVDQLARVYYRAYGPATVHDLAYWLGARVPVATAAVDRLVAAGDLLALPARLHHRTYPMYLCADQCSQLFADADDDQQRVRLLGRFDPHLLAHKEKSWLLDADTLDAGYQAVWGSKNGMIGPALLVGSTIAGTWSYKLSAKGLTVDVVTLRCVDDQARLAVAQQAALVADSFFQQPLLACAIE